MIPEQPLDASLTMGMTDADIMRAVMPERPWVASPPEAGIRMSSTSGRGRFRVGVRLESVPLIGSVLQLRKVRIDAKYASKQSRTRRWDGQSADPLQKDCIDAEVAMQVTAMVGCSIGQSVWVIRWSLVGRLVVHAQSGGCSVGFAGGPVQPMQAAPT